MNEPLSLEEKLKLAFAATGDDLYEETLKELVRRAYIIRKMDECDSWIGDRCGAREFRETA